MPTTVQFYPHGRAVYLRNFAASGNRLKRLEGLRLVMRHGDWIDRLYAMFDHACNQGDDGHEQSDRQARLKKEVDFAKEKLVFFAWSGSSGDQLFWKAEEGKKGPEIVFSYKRGLTDDVRPHFRLIGIPKGMAWRVVVDQ
jgi:hypothetical protein